MNSHTWFFRLLLLTWGCTISALAATSIPTHTNVVLFVIDDLGWSDLGCYGSRFYRTPHLDQLAAQGVRFTDAYASASICSPTRASILTGKYPARLQLTDWLPGRRDLPDQKLARPAIRQALPLAERTLAEALKSRGYVSAHIGKWHLGGPGFGPEEQGFDLNIAGDHSGTPLSYFHPFRNQQRVMPGLEHSVPGEYLTDRLTAEAETFIEKHAGRPFFLYFPHYAVHIPLHAPTNVVAAYAQSPKSGTHTNAIYAAMIERVDASVGRILRKLEALKLSDRTVILFTSDNGGLSVREGPNTPATSNAPWRAGKGYLYEGGLRVPLIVRWPGVTRSNSVVSGPVVSADLYPTLLELAGVQAAPDQVIDGISLLPAFRGDTAGYHQRPIFWHYPHYSNQGGKPGGAVREGDYKLIEFFETGRCELYHLAQDPGETRDLAVEKPDVVRSLQEKLAGWRKSVQAQEMRPNPNYREGPRAGIEGSARLTY